MTKQLPTPPVVAAHGWRDHPYVGPAKCKRCLGWGTCGKAHPDASQPDLMVITRSTCPDCHGRGHG